MRKFLVVLDDSKECLNAIRYAALRAASTAGGVQVLSVIPAAEIQHGFGVAEVMRAEARDRIEAQFEVYAKWMRDRPGIEPELVVREGDPGGELLAQIAKDEGIDLSQVVAVGDGANDLKMMATAGLGVAWNAKPRVQMEAGARLNGDTLLDLLYLFGFTREEIEMLYA